MWFSKAQVCKLPGPETCIAELALNTCMRARARQGGVVSIVAMSVHSQLCIDARLYLADCMSIGC